MSQRSLCQTLPNNYCVLKNIPHPHCSHSIIKRSDWPPGWLRVKTYYQIVMFHNYISPSGEQPQQCINSYAGTNNCRLYTNISQILLLYKTWEYYNKFDSMKSFGVSHWYVKITQCGYIEHGLEYITFYLKKNNIWHHLQSVLIPSGLRQVPRGIRICETRLFSPEAGGW